MKLLSKYTVAGAVLASLLVAGVAAFAAEPPQPATPAPLNPIFVKWNQPHEPFHVIGPIYDVGTEGFDVFLIRGQQGIVLIDGGLPESAPLIEANIHKLGFSLGDVRYIIVEHAHLDHAGGVAQLQRDTHAPVIAGYEDAPALAAGQVDYGPSAGQHYPPILVAARMRERDVLDVGEIALIAHSTPGHTKGCTSWTMPFWDNFHRYTAIFTCSISVAGNPIAGSKEYPHIAEDYRSTFAKLRKMHVDVVLAPHPNAWDRDAKLARVAKGAPNPFVDREELQRLVDASEKDFDTELAKQKAAAQ
jgi:metallo-beta-lactamase class B